MKFLGMTDCCSQKCSISGKKSSSMSFKLARAISMAFVKLSILFVENVLGELIASKLVEGIFGFYPYRASNGDAVMVD